MTPPRSRSVEALRVYLFSAYAWCVLLVIVPPMYLAVLIAPSRRAKFRVARLAGRLLLGLIGIDLSIEGVAGSLPSSMVVVANHDSFVDGLAMILAFPTPVVFAVGAHLKNQFIAGTLLKSLRCEFVGAKSGDTPHETLARLESVLEREDPLVIFPEGSLSVKPGVRRFRAGAFVVAAATARPILPVGLLGTRDVVAPGERVIRRGAVKVRIGRPIYAPGSSSRELLDLAREARDRVIALIDGDVDGP